MYLIVKFTCQFILFLIRNLYLKSLLFSWFKNGKITN